MKERREAGRSRRDREIRGGHIKRGQEAWQRHIDNGNATWNDWMAIGEALLIGRQDAMAAAETNHSIGSRYNSEFDSWLARHRFDDIDKFDRTRLIEVIDNLPAIEAWRATLTQTARLRFDHPSSVLRKRKSGTEVKESKSTLRDSVAHLREDNVGKDRRIADLEARLTAAEAPRDTDRPETSPDGSLAALLAAIETIRIELAGLRKLLTVRGDETLAASMRRKAQQSDTD